MNKLLFFLFILLLPAISFAQVESKIHPAQIGGYGAASGQVLLFDGTKWLPSTIASGSISWPLLAPNGTPIAPTYSFNENPNGGLMFEDGALKIIAGGDEGDLIVPIRIKGSNSFADAGGNIFIESGTGGTTGGNMQFDAGSGVSAGGRFAMYGGNSTQGGGGSINVGGGSGDTGGGSLFMFGGDANTGNAGNFFAIGGTSYDGNGGRMEFYGGESAGGGFGGDLVFVAGAGILGEGELRFSTQVKPVFMNTSGLRYKLLTTTEINSIATNESLTVWNTTTKKFNWYNGTTWATPLTDLTTAAGDVTGTFDNLQIAANAVGNTEIANASVTNVKISDNAVGTSKIISGSVTGLKVASGGANNGEFYAYGGAGVGWVPSPAGGDVTGTVTNLQLAQMGATSGQFLKWSGTDWIPDNISGGSSLPTGVDKQTLYYNGTTLTANSFLQNDGTNGIGVGGVPVVNDWIHSYGRVTVDAPIISKAAGANCNFRLDNTVSGVTWFWYGNNDSTLSLQADATRILTANNLKKQISIRNLKTEKAIYTDLFTTSATSHQINGLDSEVRLSPGNALGSVTLPEIVVGTPGTNQVNAGFVLYLNFSSTIATSVSRSGSTDVIEQNMAIGNRTSITNQANYVFAHRIVAVDANTWVIY